MLGIHDQVWHVSIALGILAALLNWPVKEQPVRMRMNKKRLLYGILAALGLAALLALIFWGWTRMGLAALQGGLGFC